MKILIACEESQAITIELRSLGHEAYSCDIQECSGGHEEWHIIGDAREEAYSGKYDMMIAHPPCTFMSKAGAYRMYPVARQINQQRYESAMEAKDFFLCLMNAPIDKISIENPTPLRVVGLPLHTQVIQPFEYGHPYSKRTLLWLKGLPLLKPTNIIETYTPYLPSNVGGAKRGQKFQSSGASGSKNRSKTFTGIAKAMADQWTK